MWDGVDGNSWADDESSVDVTDDAWEAAPSTDHQYSHSYVCDESSDNYQALDSGSAYAGKCIYEIRLQVEDAWGFCSGLQDIDDGNDDFRDTGSGCNSYDEFPSYVIVPPN
jgi:hypothetical protein